MKISISFLVPFIPLFIGILAQQEQSSEKPSKQSDFEAAKQANMIPGGGNPSGGGVGGGGVGGFMPNLGNSLGSSLPHGSGGNSPQMLGAPISALGSNIAAPPGLQNGIPIGGNRQSINSNGIPPNLSNTTSMNSGNSTLNGNKTLSSNSNLTNSTNTSTPTHTATQTVYVDAAMLNGFEKRHPYTLVFVLLQLTIMILCG